MTTAELAKKVRFIEITTRKAVTAAFSGEYRSAFKGRGIEFDEVREYQRGDDIRAIDWNVTARSGKLFTKRFMEERELTIILMADLSASGRFGSTSISKQETITELCALLAFSAIKNNDRVGLLIFTDRVDLFIPPRKGQTHVLRLIRELVAFRPGRRGTSISAALTSLYRLVKRSSVVFLVSDFLDNGYEHELRITAEKHDLVAIPVSDSREETLPSVGLLELEDAENGTRILIDAADRGVREEYARQAVERREKLEQFFRSAGIDFVPVRAGGDYVQKLVRFFLARERRY